MSLSDNIFVVFGKSVLIFRSRTNVLFSCSYSLTSLYEFHRKLICFLFLFSVCHDVYSFNLMNLKNMGGEHLHVGFL